MTGFRVGPRGVQGVYNITPDLTTLGKIIGGGMPVGAFGGRKDIMAYIAPLGPVYQAGTLSGNPVAVAAGLATLKLIQAPGFYERLAQQTQRLVNGFNSVAKQHHEVFCADAIGGMFGVYFSESVPSSFAQVNQSNRERFNQFFHAMLNEGVYLAPSAFEAGFVSVTHTDEVIDATLQAAHKAFLAIPRLK
jgi:glutamate-1-semialdehyde 2,1-aminomutase